MEDRPVAQVDFASASKKVVLLLIGKVPEVGSILSGFISAIWPEEAPEDPWKAIKDQVAALVDVKIAEEVLDEKSKLLNALKQKVDLYLEALKNKDKGADVCGAFRDVHVALTGAPVEFTSDNPAHAEQLLALFVQVVNLELALIRDGIAHGKDWGLGDADIDALVTQLNDGFEHSEPLITWAQNWVSKTIEAGKQSRAITDPSDVAQFNALNGFVRGMTLVATDFSALWPFFDARKYPTMPDDFHLDREIYSDAVGRKGAQPIALKPSVGRLCGLDFWCNRKLVGFEASYQKPDNTVEKSGYMGAPKSGDEPLESFAFENEGDCILAVSTHSGDILDYVAFTGLYQGQPYDYGGYGNVGGDEVRNFAYPDHVLSSVSFADWGVWGQDVQASRVVFGFKLLKH
jgi:hypothetical protein